MKIEEKERLEKKIKDTDKSLVAHCGKNFFKFRKVYNVLCRSCKFKIAKKPDAEIKEYCNFCRGKVERILK